MNSLLYSSYYKGAIEACQGPGPYWITMNSCFIPAITKVFKGMSRLRTLLDYHELLLYSSYYKGAIEACQGPGPYWITMNSCFIPAITKVFKGMSRLRTLLDYHELLLYSSYYMGAIEACQGPGPYWITMNSCFIPAITKVL